MRVLTSADWSCITVWDSWCGVDEGRHTSASTTCISQGKGAKQPDLMPNSQRENLENWGFDPSRSFHFGGAFPPDQGGAPVLDPGLPALRTAARVGRGLLVFEARAGQMRAGLLECVTGGIV